MKATLSALTALSLAACDVSSGGGSGSKTGSDASEFIQRVFQADLPPGHTDAKTISRSLMTTVVQGRLRIPEREFEVFLKSSALLPDALEPGNPLEGRSNSTSWWTPGALEDAKGLSCSWMDGDTVATCDLATGAEAGEGDHIVYFMIVYEHQDSTGARPTVHADPSWQPKTNKLQPKR